MPEAQAPPRILVLNPFGIGDVLFSTPLVATLRAAFPDAYLAYLCNARTREIVSGNPHVNRVYVFEKDEYRALWQRSKLAALKRFLGFLGELRAERFRIAVDLSLGDRYSLILMLLGITQRIGFNYRGRGRYLTASIPITGFHERHVVEHYLDVARLLGCRPVPQPLAFSVRAETSQWADAWLGAHAVNGRQRLVGLVPGGGASWGVEAVNKRWAPERFADVADALVDRFHVSVLLLGQGEDEQALCRQVAGGMRHRAIDASGQTTLDQFAALLRRCELVICNDGGPVHVAVSQGCRVVAIFGPVDDGVYGPFPRSDRTAVVAHQLPCRPCYQSFKMPPCPINLKCLRDVTADEVLAAAEQQLRGAS